MTKKRKRKEGGHGTSNNCAPDSTSKMSRKTKHFDLSEEEKKELDILFGKKLNYSQSLTLGIDAPSLIQKINSCVKFHDEMEGESSKLPWQDDELMQLKKEMNALKDQLSSKDIETWHRHTTECNLAGKIIPYVKSLDVELCTQAWVKFYEILHAFPIVPTDQSFLSVHLCEAPGAFIAALNHFLQHQGFFPHHHWEWMATSLNPYHEANSLSEMIADDRLIRSSYRKWYFGPDGRGDIKSPGHIEGLVESVRLLERKQKTRGKVLLVTADGSRDCQENPAEQEALLSQLHWCEALAACLMLAPSGVLVLKVFTMLEAPAICLLCLLNLMFEQVHCIKPATSKSGNSEMYLVCCGYSCMLSTDVLWHMLTLARDKGVSWFLREEDIPPPFLQEHRHMCRQFAHWQWDTIQRNMHLFEHVSPQILLNLNTQQDAAVDHFAEMTYLCYSRHFRRIVPHCREEQEVTSSEASKGKGQGHYHQWQHRYLKGTFHLRQNMRTLPFSERIDLMALRPLTPPATVLGSRFPLEEEEVNVWSLSETSASASLPCSVLNSRLCDVSLVDDYNFLLQNSQLSKLRQERWHRHLVTVADLLTDVIASITEADRTKHGADFGTQSTPALSKKGEGGGGDGGFGLKHFGQQVQHHQHHHHHHHHDHQTNSQKYHHHHRSHQQDLKQQHQYPQQLQTQSQLQQKKNSPPFGTEQISSHFNPNSSQPPPPPVLAALPLNPSSSSQPLTSTISTTSTTTTIPQSVPVDCHSPVSVAYTAQLVWIENSYTDPNQIEGEHRLSLLNAFLDKLKKRTESRVETKVKDEGEFDQENPDEIFCEGKKLVYFRDITSAFLPGVGGKTSGCEELLSRRVCLQRVIQLLEHLPEGCHLVLLTSSFLTRFHAGLLYILARQFHNICVTSDPNLWLHQLVVCRGYQGRTTSNPALGHFLSSALQRLEEEEEQDGERREGRQFSPAMGMVETVPFIHIFNDRRFVQFAVECNSFLLGGFINLLLHHHKRQQEEGRQGEVGQKEGRQEEGRQEEGKQEEGRQEEGKREEEEESSPGGQLVRS